MSDTGQPPGFSWADEMAAVNPVTSTEKTLSPSVASAARTIGSQAATPATGTSAMKVKSWASVLGGGLPSRVDNNVLEVILEKDVRDYLIVKESECAHIMGKLGLDPRPDIHVEGVQICPQGRGVIYITLQI